MNNPTTLSTILSVKNITRSFWQGSTKLTVLNDINFDIKAGEMVALVGQSGSGKSTLLHLCGLLEKPESGEILIEQKLVQNLSDAERTGLRRTTMGFIYQYHHLLREFSALENVMLPQMIKGINKYQAKQYAQTLLSRVGLSHRLNHRPAQLSGGEQQRVAIARALANNPKLLLADEPTGNLDHGTSQDIFGLLLNLVKESSLATLIATHNMDLALRMDRILKLEDGIIS
ncbi:MAG: ABC transporter ATP-binding protein [Alphaproteobacteria bacterium]|nr:ABC transporter ATP-binding protein [Alphaproteobacteria bacterium]